MPTAIPFFTLLYFALPRVAKLTRVACFKSVLYWHFTPVHVLQMNETGLMNPTTWRSTAPILTASLLHRNYYNSDVINISCWCCNANIIITSTTPIISRLIRLRQTTSRPQWRLTFTAQRIVTRTTAIRRQYCTITHRMLLRPPLNASMTWTACNDRAHYSPIGWIAVNCDQT